MVASGALVTINSVRLSRPFEVKLLERDSTTASAEHNSPSLSPLPPHFPTADGFAFLNAPTAAEAAR